MNGAVFSLCGKYRYALSRRWIGQGLACFIMLNPSTADAQKDDPTIRRCINYAKAWGFGGLEVVNLFAYRATDPDALYQLSKDQAIGPGNNHYIRETAYNSALVVCAWGTHGALFDRGIKVRNALQSKGFMPHVLRFTRDGHPAHPLYLPKNLEPVPWH